MRQFEKIWKSVLERIVRCIKELVFSGEKSLSPINSDSTDRNVILTKCSSGHIHRGIGNALFVDRGGDYSTRLELGEGGEYLKEHMSRDELFKRTQQILNPEIARDEVFLFDGIGSGGARVAEEATRFGVGTILLVDRPGERLEEHNIIRHTLGYHDLGRLKVEALRDRLLDINPGCTIETHSIDVSRDVQAHRQLVEQATQVHICTDNELSKHMTNELCVELGKPMIFASVFDGGCGGETGRVMPGDACYACIAR